MISKLLILCLFLLGSIGNINAQNLVDTTIIDIKNFHKVDEGVYRSAQPSEKQFHQLEQAGFKEVLNLRQFLSDNSKAHKTSLILYRMTMMPNTVNEESLFRAMCIIQNRRGPILIHCRRGADRTGAVIAMYRITFQGWTKEQAIDELRNGGYNFQPLFGNIPKTINNIDIENFRKKVFERGINQDELSETFIPINPEPPIHKEYNN